MRPGIQLVFSLALATSGCTGSRTGTLDAGMLDAAATLDAARVDTTVPFDASPEDADEDSALPVLGPPLGVTPAADGSSMTFRVASPRATRIELELFAAPIGQDAQLSRPLTRAADATTWEATLTLDELRAAGISGAIYYGYRAWGPNWPYVATWAPGEPDGFVADVDADGNRFDPNKLLIDPYARELSHDPSRPGVGDYASFSSGPTSRAIDTARAAPKGIVVAELPTSTVAAPTRAFSDDVVYETHVRGFTKLDVDVDEACRGTYAGAMARAQYLADLGVTAIELMPIQETNNDANDVVASSAGDNYWGYSTLAYFAPDRRYACDQSPGGPTREVRSMVDAFHARGIKVLLDVVYNHTAEGGVSSRDPSRATLLSLRGLDNPDYYELSADHQRYVDDTGAGPNVQAASPLAAQLVIDSLRYWHESIGVDGFRFDLAPVLGNRCTQDCFSFSGSASAGLLARIARELGARPVTGGRGTDLVAEPWGVGAGTYQLGAFPQGWSEWNGAYRDFVRADLNGLAPGFSVTRGWLSDRVAGSQELFGDDGRGPSASANYVVSHDGFTLRDEFSCATKQNDQPWPYGPSSGGTDQNYSSDRGGDPAAQRQAARTALALVMVSTGVPMITGGDEIYRTQYCNNNAYNLDSDKNWIDWASMDTPFATFAGRMIRLRAAHPALRPASYATGTDHDGNGVADVTWLDSSGGRASGAYLDAGANRYLAWRIDGDEAHDSARSILVLYSSAPSTATTSVTLPSARADTGWYRVADTASWMEPRSNSVAPGEEELLTSGHYDVHGGSLVLFIER